jgi:hypothetical protein
MKTFIAASALALLGLPAHAAIVNIDLGAAVPAGEFQASGTLIDADGASFAQLFEGLDIIGADPRLISGTPSGALTLKAAGSLGILGAVDSRLMTPIVRAPMPGNPPFSGEYGGPLSVLFDNAADSFTFTIGGDTGSRITAALFSASGALVKTEIIDLPDYTNTITLSSDLAFQGVTFYDNTDSFGVTFTKMSYNVAAVPEPETYAMLLGGLGLIGFMARRRTQA